MARHAPSSFPGQFVPTDLGDPKVTAALASRLAERRDVLGIVNIAKHERFEAVNFADFSAIMDLNVRPALQLTQALLVGMRNARFGRIVNVSSLVARGLPFRTSYAAAKSALESLTRTMAAELAPDGITANAVAPGPLLRRSCSGRTTQREVKARGNIWPKCRWRVLPVPRKSRPRLSFLLATRPDSSRDKRSLSMGVRALE